MVLPYWEYQESLEEGDIYACSKLLIEKDASYKL